MSSSQLNLSWTDQSSNETGFNIERCTGATCTAFSLLTSVGANVISYQNTALDAGTTYRYRVSAVNATGSSSPSAIASATTNSGGTPTTPAAPTALVATPGPGAGHISLVWVDNATNETGYRVFRCGSSTCGSSIAQVAELGANTTTFVDSVPPASGRYSYFVRAFNPAGMSRGTNVSSADAP